MKKFKLPSVNRLFPQSNITKPRKPATRLAARLTQPAFDDYEEEPTTKLSTAFVVVLVLHLVAVGGVYAFHSIKAKRREADGTALTASAGPLKESAAKTEVAAKIPAVVAPPVQAAASAAPFPSGAALSTKTPAAQPQEKVAVGPSAVVQQPAKPAVGAGAKVAAAASAPSGDSVLKTYTVLKGDNPVAIAKRMGVNYEELLKLNGVEDPKRLKPGQVLKLPVRIKATGN